LPAPSYGWLLRANVKDAQPSFEPTPTSLALAAQFKRYERQLAGGEFVNATKGLSCGPASRYGEGWSRLVAAVRARSDC